MDTLKNNNRVTTEITKGKLNIEVTTTFYRQQENPEDSFVKFDVDKTIFEASALDLIPIMQEAIKVFFEALVEIGFTEKDAKQTIINIVNSATKEDRYVHIEK